VQRRGAPVRTGRRVSLARLSGRASADGAGGCGAAAARRQAGWRGTLESASLCGDASVCGISLCGGMLCAGPVFARSLFLQLERVRPAAAPVARLLTAVLIRPVDNDSRGRMLVLPSVGCRSTRGGDGGDEPLQRVLFARFAYLLTALHAPLRERFGLLEGALPAARRLFGFLRPALFGTPKISRLDCSRSRVGFKPLRLALSGFLTSRRLASII